MSVVVVGSVAYDSVKTSHGSREDALGGSATYFSIAASYFDSVQMVGVVGEDFAQSDIDLLKSHNVDVSGLEIAQGKTFRWAGEYDAEDVKHPLDAGHPAQRLRRLFAPVGPPTSEDAFPVSGQHST